MDAPHWVSLPIIQDTGDTLPTWLGKGQVGFVRGCAVVGWIAFLPGHRGVGN